MALSTQDRKEIADIIRHTVNGKIDQLSLRHERLEQRLDPIIDGLKWIEVTRKFVIWVAVPTTALIALFKGVK